MAISLSLSILGVTLDLNLHWGETPEGLDETPHPSDEDTAPAGAEAPLRHSLIPEPFPVPADEWDAYIGDT